MKIINLTGDECNNARMAVGLYIDYQRAQLKESEAAHAAGKNGDYTEQINWHKKKLEELNKLLKKLPFYDDTQ